MKHLRTFLRTFCLLVMLTQLKACPSKSGTPKKNEQPPAPLKMTKLGDRCYYFEARLGENWLNWTSAQQFCRSHGLQLASIETEEENNLIWKHMKKTMPGNWGIWNVYLGGSDSEEEGTWRWINGQQLNFTDWGEGEPSNDREDDDCLMLDVYQGGSHYWNNYRCSETWRFVCEQDGDCP